MIPLKTYQELLKLSSRKLAGIDLSINMICHLSSPNSHYRLIRLGSAFQFCGGQPYIVQDHTLLTCYNTTYKKLPMALSYGHYNTTVTMLLEWLLLLVWY